MDDLLVGANSETDLLELRSQITRLLGLGKFELHKWRSNVENFIDNPQDESLTISEERGIKTLGVFWNSYLDKFHFEFCNTDNNKVTKRIVLSELAQLFDPLGLLNPIIVLGKIVLQELWLMKLDWDESLPQVFDERWRKYREQLVFISDFKFPRFIGGNVFGQI